MKKNVDTAKTARTARRSQLARLTAIYAAATLVVLTGVAGYFNHIYAQKAGSPSGTPTATQPAATATPTLSPSPTPTPPYHRSFRLDSLPADAGPVVFTRDGRFAIYRKDGSIVVLDTAADAVKETLTEPYPILDHFLMVSQDIMVYFYWNSKESAFKVKTYNFGTGVHYVRQTIPKPAGTVLKMIDYSSGMSFVVYTTASSSGGSWSTGFLNTASRIRDSGIKSAMIRMLSSNQQFRVFFETPGHVLYRGGTRISGLSGKQMQLIGLDEIDNAYGLDMADGVTVYKITGTAVTGSFQLPSADHKAIATDKLSVYAIYDTYVLDLVAKEVTRLEIPSGLTYVALADDDLYFRDADGNYLVFEMPFK